MTLAGGAEFLLSLNHPLTNCSATENFVPNVELCKDKLLPLGVDFKRADGGDILPFDDASFDIIINPNFSVENCLDNLYKAQALLEKNGCVEGRIHRILLVCRKR